jgi:hypothetical protein
MASLIRLLKCRGHAPIPVPARPDSSRLDYLRQLLAETREEVARADAKASLLFSAFGVVTSAVAAILVADDWSPFDLHNGIEWVWWLGAAVAGAALLLLGMAVVPRISHGSSKENLYFFAHVAEHATLRELDQQLAVASLDSWKRTVDQLWTVSRVAHRKYVLTRRSMILFFVAVALLGAASLGNLLLTG